MGAGTKYCILPSPQHPYRPVAVTHELLAKTFDTWAHQGRHSGMEREHGDVVRQVLARMDPKPGDMVLDLGCGSGWATRLLAQARPGISAVGIDVAPAMIAQAEREHRLTIRARYEVAPFESLPFPERKFDRAFSMEALYYAVDLPKALAELARVLKPGAKADIVVDYYAENSGTAAWPKICGVNMLCLSEAQWTAAFRTAGFASVELERVRDSRGPGLEAAFQPSECYADWATWKAVKDAGSLWIRALRAS